MLNFKQEELIKKLIKDIQQKFPEVKFIDVSPSPENPNDLWVSVTAPEGEEREFELREFASDKSMDILLDFGYHILIMPTQNAANNNQQQDMEFSLAEN